jgi:hypothetical protein
MLGQRTGRVVPAVPRSLCPAAPHGSARLRVSFAPAQITARRTGGGVWVFREIAANFTSALADYFRSFASNRAQYSPSELFCSWSSVQLPSAAIAG